MNLSPKRLLLYKRIATLFFRYARPAILEQTSFSDTVKVDEEVKKSDSPEEFACALEAMGPTFVKLGQLLSTRGDLMPPRYLVALERLQDDVEPISYEEVVGIIERGLGARLSKIFDTFDQEPLASASLGQVHRATLRDGRAVVVKAQRPDAKKNIFQDLEALAEIAAYADKHSELGRKYHFSGIIEQFRRSLVDELDYLLEAQNLRQMKQSLVAFDNIIVPEPIEALCSKEVLTMEFIEGIKITELPGIAKIEIDGKALAEEVFEAYLHQVLIDGVYHADPHPGNLLITPDSQIVLLDLGMVGRLDETMQDELFNLMTAISSNQSEKVSEIALRIVGDFDPEMDKRSLIGEITALVGKVNGASIDRLQFGSIMMEIMRICGEHGLNIPKEMSMLGKTLLNLDRVGSSLSPEFDPNESIRRNINALASKRTFNSLKQGNVMSGLLELKELVSKSPQRINDLITNLSENKFRVNVDAVDEKALIDGFQKIANRIAGGIVIAALVIGASIMMDIKSDFTIWGYPGLPILMFMIAGIVGIGFLFSVLRNDD